MSILDRLFGGRAAAPPPAAAPHAGADPFTGNVRALALDLPSYLLGGAGTQSGAIVTTDAAMKNTAVFRSVSLLAFSIGMLPLHLYRSGPDRDKAEEHPLFTVLHRRPNGWMTAFDFRSLMQAWVLLHGDAFALKIRRGADIIGLAPMDPARTAVKQDDDLRVSYEFRHPKGGLRRLAAEDVFHVRGFSLDGIRGRSLVRQAAEAIGLAMQADQAAARLFGQGMLAGGALEMPEQKRLSAEALDRLKASMEAREGAENAGRWLILEEGLAAKPFGATARDSQHIEVRRHQIEEIARVFGVPRPLLMVDDTSWGTGIDVLGQLFVRYGLNPWFTAWEQAIERCLLTEREQGRFYAKFNAGGLLRGSMKDQAEFFSRALGAGGHQPWMHQNEVRDFMELGERDDLPARAGGGQRQEGREP